VGLEHIGQQQSIGVTQYYERRFAQLEAAIASLQHQLHIVNEKLKKIEGGNHEHR